MSNKVKLEVTESDIRKADITKSNRLKHKFNRTYCPLEYAAMRTFKARAETPNYHTLVLHYDNKPAELYYLDSPASVFMHAYDNNRYVYPTALWIQPLA